MDFAPFVDFPLLSFVLCGLLMVKIFTSSDNYDQIEIVGRRIAENEKANAQPKYGQH